MSAKISTFAFRLFCVLILITLLFIVSGGAPAQAKVCSLALTVANTADSGAGSLRQAIADVCSGGAITFAPGLSGQTITLSSDELDIDKDLTIDGEANNITVSGGGAFRVFEIDFGVTCTIKNLTVANGKIGSKGGGIENAGTLTVQDCTFSGNKALFGEGGGIYNPGTLTVQRCTFSGNYGKGDDGGGGICNAGQATLTVEDSTFSGNTSANNGGGISNSGTATVTGSTFSDNVVLKSDGGGIRNMGSLVVANSTFSGNSANGDGGGLYCKGTMETVTNCTFSGNSAINSGGGIYSNGSSATVNNTIVAKSTNGNCWGIIAGGTNLDDDGSCGLGSTNSATILLGVLGNNGGPTQTMALLAGSSAIDTGDKNTCDSPPVSKLDQRGGGRPKPTGGACDIGAFELDDTIAPDTTIDSKNPPVTPTNSAAMTFAFSGTDADSGVNSFECDVDGGGFAACASPKTHSGLADGSHTFQVRAIDNVGNVDKTPASYTWVVDTTPPDTSITSQPVNPSGSSGASFMFTGSDPGGSGVAGYECQLDGGGFSACMSPEAHSGLSDGSHTFQVRAIDGAGNTDGSPASYTWVVDTTPPDTSLTDTPPNPSGSAGAAFTFSASDPVPGSASYKALLANYTAVPAHLRGSAIAGFECQLDGGGWGSCTSPKSYSGLADGSHAFEVRAIDGAGNTDATPASYTWVVDTVVPATTTTVPAATTTTTALTTTTVPANNDCLTVIPSKVFKLRWAGLHARDELLRGAHEPGDGPDYDHGLDPWTIMVLFRILKYATPLQFFIMIGDSDTVFTRQDAPQWNTAAIETLLKLKVGNRTMLALAFINPFTAEAGVYEVTIGDCAGSMELL